MAAQPRNPHVLAYQAVRDAENTEQARRVYHAVKSSPCYAVSACAMSADCPFYVDCTVAEGASDAGS